MIGVVLAGGRSTRLGQDKVRLRLPGDGRDMLARTADLLAACTDGVVISCRAPDAGEETLALPGIRSIPDAESGLGPLGGVWSALRELRQPILVLSCDLPFMDMPTLRRLIDARGDETLFKGLNNESSTYATTRFVQDERTLIGQNLYVSYEFLNNPWLQKHLGIQTLTISGDLSDLFYWSTIKQERGLSYPFSRRFSFSSEGLSAGVLTSGKYR